MGENRGMKFARSMVLAGLFVFTAAAQQPTVSDNGVLNAASYIKFGSEGHANAPGSLVSIFGTTHRGFYSPVLHRFPHSWEMSV